MATRKAKPARKSTARKPAARKPAKSAARKSTAARARTKKPARNGKGKAKAAKCAVCGAEVKPSKCFCSLDCYIAHRQENG